MAKDDVPNVFDPALWLQVTLFHLLIQRRSLINRILHDFPFRNILDIGCGEGALLEILLNSTHFSNLYGIDVDQQSLDSAKRNCCPSEHHQLNLRESQMEVNLYLGSIDKVDPKFKDIDVITSAEVIEHLYESTLLNFKKNVFGYYKPKLVIITTPNAEFNVNFPSLNYNTPESTFRHDDHKFEWTRNEFQDWGNAICSEYGYTVVYTGVGYLRNSPHQVGPCSQVAIFSKNETNTISNNTLSVNGGDTSRYSIFEEEPYKNISKITFPFFDINPMDNDTIIKTIINMLKMNDVLLRIVNGTLENPIEFDTVWDSMSVKKVCGTRENLINAFNSHNGLKYFILKSFPVICEYKPWIQLRNSISSQLKIEIINLNM